MNQVSPNLRFFGNLCKADDKMAEIRAFQREIEDLIMQENGILQNLKIEYDDNPKLYDKKFHFEHTLKSNLRNSTIVSLVTFLEIELQNYCQDLQKVLSLKVKYDEFKGSILEQFKIYTSKLAGLNINFDDQLWSSIKEVVELRNCIVHHDGHIEDWYGRKFTRANSIESLSKRFNSIQIDDRDIIVLDNSACEECITIIESFINMIYDCALNKFPRADEEKN